MKCRLIRPKTDFRPLAKPIFETFESLPRGKRRDSDFVSTAIERAVRNAVGVVWGKKPQVHVLVVEV